jgi:nucleotide-binding universal stress UspA family protein
VRWAAHEATVRNVPLTPVHVVCTPAVSSSALSWPAVPIPAELRQWQEDEAAKVMADAIKLVEDSATEGARPEIKSELFFSAPVPTLVDLSKETQMVVVGSHSRGGFAGMLLGSVSTAVVHGARIPVIVARQPSNWVYSVMVSIHLYHRANCPAPSRNYLKPHH